ncbi:MAG: hypothetical protein RBS39_03020 [Phycisphaerales bacterium]|jgi:hypothetical protein|nr:hypothetical protein [Phycisphaerales bacterium]
MGTIAIGIIGIVLLIAIACIAIKFMKDSGGGGLGGGLGGGNWG